MRIEQFNGVKTCWYVRQLSSQNLKLRRHFSKKNAIHCIGVFKVNVTVTFRDILQKHEKSILRPAGYQLKTAK